MLPVPCAAVTHAHQASDYRVALVRVSEVRACSFTFEDLQENVVSAEPIIIADCAGSPSVAALSSAAFGQKIENVQMLCMAPVKGAFGILVYCAHCRAGFLLRTTED